MATTDLVKPTGLIRLRYRDKFVYLKTDSEHFGTMTKYLDSDLIEFDFSECEVVRTEPIEIEQETKLLEGQR